MNEPTPVDIPVEEQVEKMRSDVVALVSRDVHCPLAKAIADCLVALDKAIEAHTNNDGIGLSKVE